MQLIFLGLIQKWYSEMIFNQTMNHLEEYRQTQTPNFRTLTLADLQLSFFVLSSGILLSIVVLLIESCVKFQQVLFF